MKYFMLKQDTSLENAVELKGFNNSQKVNMLKSDADKYRDLTGMDMISNENTVYPDLIQAPVLMVSEELHDLFKLYEPTIIYKIVVLTDKERKKQKVYRLVLPDIIDGLNEKTTYTKVGWLEKMVLDRNKIGDYNIFQIKAGLDIYFIVSLDVAEAMLKRGVKGIKFIEVEVI